MVKCEDLTTAEESKRMSLLELCLFIVLNDIYSLLTVSNDIYSLFTVSNDIYSLFIVSNDIYSIMHNHMSLIQ